MSRIYFCPRSAWDTEPGRFAPPEANRELLHFALVVVAHKHLGRVADVVVAADRPLPVVLIENLRLGVVVAAGRIGIGVGAGKSLASASMLGSMQVPLAGPEQGLNGGAAEFRNGGGGKLAGSLAGCGDGSFSGYLTQARSRRPVHRQSAQSLGASRYPEPGSSTRSRSRRTAWCCSCGSGFRE